MRTKTLLLSALLGSLGTVSVIAQNTNVYSLNAVGYINITVNPGFNIISCPLITSPDNTVGTVLNNASGIYTHDQVFFYTPAGGYDPADTAETVSASPGLGKTTNANGWSKDGTNVASPGVGFWFLNNNGTNQTITIVGTVPTGSITNTLLSGFNLVGSVVPMSGDLASNSISALTNYNLGDAVYTYNPLNPPATAYTKYTSGHPPFATHGYNSNWTAAGDPIVPNVGQGFWYENNVGTTVEWVENYSVAQ